MKKTVIQKSILILCVLAFVLCLSGFNAQKSVTYTVYDGEDSYRITFTGALSDKMKLKAGNSENDVNACFYFYQDNRQIARMDFVYDNMIEDILSYENINVLEKGEVDGDAYVFYSQENSEERCYIRTLNESFALNITDCRLEYAQLKKLTDGLKVERIQPQEDSAVGSGAVRLIVSSGRMAMAFAVVLVFILTKMIKPAWISLALTALLMGVGSFIFAILGANGKANLSEQMFLSAAKGLRYASNAIFYAVLILCLFAIMEGSMRRFMKEHAAANPYFQQKLYSQEQLGVVKNLRYSAKKLYKVYPFAFLQETQGVYQCVLHSEQQYLLVYFNRYGKHIKSELYQKEQQ